ncbi:hypothetical protein LQZ18_03915 [Lachnospiraceae bacterium ZAX-1]
MWKKIYVTAIACLMLFPLYVYFFSNNTQATEQDMQKAEKYFTVGTSQSSPQKKADGSKYTIAYVDIDPYPASGEMLYYYIDQLKQLGWISYEGELPFDPKDTDAKELIFWLAEQDLGDYIQFSKEACYYLAIEDEETCADSLQGLIDTKQVDLIFCMGTWPGRFAKALENETIPVMIYFCVDPVGAGFAKDSQYSGEPNIWSHVNYTVYNKQMQFYYDNYPFSNIGMTYYDETVAALRAYRQVALENKFQITEKQIETLSDESPEAVKEYYAQLETVFSELIEQGIDAFMLNTDIIKDQDRIAEMLEPFYEANIPVFVQNGEYYVKNGALMTVTASDAKEQAPFVANACARMLLGEKPGDINQEYITPPYLSINLAVADRLGYKVKEELILSAEKLYDK